MGIGNRANGSHHARPDYKRSRVRRQAIILGSTATVDHFVGRVRRVLQSLRLFGACHKKQCRVDWLSNRILKSSDDTAATPDRSAPGKLCPSRARLGCRKTGRRSPSSGSGQLQSGQRPERLSGAGGRWKKIQGRRCRPRRRANFLIFWSRFKFANDFKWLRGRQILRAITSTFSGEKM
jgi:hypothetical protein